MVALRLRSQEHRRPPYRVVVSPPGLRAVVSSGARHLDEPAGTHVGARPEAGMSRAIRVASSPSQLVDRTRPITFEYNNRRIDGWEGDTIASAMLAAGVDVFSRSFKYHRPRGLL